MADRQDTIRRVLTQLEQIAAHLPPMAFRVDAERYSHEIGRLEAFGYDLDEYKIHFATDLYPNPSRSVRPGHDRVVQHQLLDKQVKAVLRYFAIEDKPIHFTGPIPSKPD